MPNGARGDAPEDDQGNIQERLLRSQARCATRLRIRVQGASMPLPHQPHERLISTWERNSMKCRNLGHE
jgi:hypothetical protein